MKKEDVLGLDFSEFIEKFTITDKEAIRIATNMPKSVPDSVLIKELKPIGLGMFHGDKLPENWSANNHFTKKDIYPIYVNENDEFAISETNGVGMKLTPKAWGLKFF